MASAASTHATAYCNDCGAGIPVTAQFCQGCGKSTATLRPQKAVRKQVTAWDLGAVGFTFLWNYYFLRILASVQPFPYHDPGYLLGRYLAPVFMATILAYVCAGRKKVRNPHRFCQIYGWTMLALPLAPLFSVVAKASGTH